MGSSSSKAVQTASKVASSTAPRAARKYPTRNPPPSTTQRQTTGPSLTENASLGPTVHPEAGAAQNRTEAVERDASDPDLELNARLRQLGPVVPNPTFSPSSTANPSSSDQPSSSAHSNTDPTTSPSTFKPSASNPAQTIFPTNNPAQNVRQNPAVSLLTARYRLAEEAEKEFELTGRSGDRGRSFIDITTLRQMVSLREQGIKEEEIERRLGLRDGVVARLGRRGVVNLPQ